MPKWYNHKPPLLKVKENKKKKRRKASINKPHKTKNKKSPQFVHTHTESDLIPCLWQLQHSLTDCDMILSMTIWEHPFPSTKNQSTHPHNHTQRPTLNPISNTIIPKDPKHFFALLTPGYLGYNHRSIFNYPNLQILHDQQEQSPNPTMSSKPINLKEKTLPNKTLNHI